MRFLLPKDLKNVVEDVQNNKNIKIFRLIESFIKNNWGYKIIKGCSRHSYRTLYSKTHEIRLDRREVFGDPEGFYYLEEKEYYEGILTYDKILERFVVFQFKPKFSYEESVKYKKEGLLDGINEDFEFEMNLDNKFISSIQSKKFNPELIKLIIITNEVPTTELLKYIHTNHSNWTEDRGIEILKLTPYENDVITFEKIQNDFTDVIDKTKNIKETDFFKYFNLSKKTINNYLLFKEYLSFNFNCRLVIFSGCDRDSLFKFYQETLLEDWSDDYETGPIELSTNDEVQSFLDDVIKEYNVKGLDHKGKLGKVNYMEFSELNIRVYTQGFEFDFRFVFKFYHNKINVTVNLIEGEDEDRWENTGILDFIINNRSNYEYFDNLMRTIPQKRNKIQNKRTKKKGNNINDLPF